jgi:hypothetical protein
VRFVVISDEELTRLALAADPNEPLDDDAVPISEVLGEDPGLALVPAWLMPASRVSVSPHHRRRVAVLGLFVLALLAVNAVGLCVTNGYLEIAW